MANNNAIRVDRLIAVGEVFLFSFYWRDGAGNFIDFDEGYHVKCQARSGGNLLLDLSDTNGGVTYSMLPGIAFSDDLGDRSVATIKAPNTITKDLPIVKAEYDVFVIDPAGDPRRLFYGTLEIVAAQTVI